MLSERNQALLALLARENPGSLTELARLAGREKSSLSRTLKTLTRYGLVELETGRGGGWRCLIQRRSLDAPKGLAPVVLGAHYCVFLLFLKGHQRESSC